VMARTPDTVVPTGTKKITVDGPNPPP